jgi:hypothetical protein
MRTGNRFPPRCSRWRSSSSHNALPGGCPEFGAHARPACASANALASSRVTTVAEASLHPLTFCPAHKGEKSPRPRLSAAARKGAMADVASGNGGAAALIGPSSLMRRFTIPRAGPPVKRLVSAVTRAASLFSAARLDGTGGGFRAQQIGRSDLHARRAERHGCRHALRVRNAARSDNRDFHRAHDLRHQRESARLGAEILRQKDTAMAARFQSLRDDCVDSMRLQPARLVNGCRRRQDFRTAAAHSRQQIGRGQTEVKTHNRGPDFAQHNGSLGAEGRPPGTRRNGACVDSVLLEVGRKRGPPCGFALPVELGLHMAKEIHVERLRGLRTQRRQLPAHRVDTQQGAGKRAEAAGVGNRDRERAALHARHRGLNDRKLYSKEILQNHCPSHALKRESRPRRAMQRRRRRGSLRRYARPARRREALSRPARTTRARRSSTGS